ncbi:unnamed protein product [Moneuplotes crassus]|uniref:Mitochondrial import inner membrane translocase subunit TIM50 n=1 Tax=Euplotes crassus TaxID=5936 RepID=A0AAD1UB71_EUPCR|nr:unnamed protein product [Moneuplotes crassus]
MAEHFEIVIFTASLSQYAKPLIKKLDRKGIGFHQLYREHCTFHKSTYFVKDLSKLGRKLKDIIIVDNSPSAYLFHPENAIPILSWYSNKSDSELYKLMSVLKTLATVRDVTEESLLNWDQKDAYLNYSKMRIGKKKGSNTPRYTFFNSCSPQRASSKTLKNPNKIPEKPQKEHKTPKASFKKKFSQTTRLATNHRGRSSHFSSLAKGQNSLRISRQTSCGSRMTMNKKKLFKDPLKYSHLYTPKGSMGQGGFVRCFKDVTRENKSRRDFKAKIETSGKGGSRARCKRIDTINGIKTTNNSPKAPTFGVRNMTKKEMNAKEAQTFPFSTTSPFTISSNPPLQKSHLHISTNYYPSAYLQGRNSQC